MLLVCRQLWKNDALRKSKLYFNIVFDSNLIVPTFAEKMSGIIISKIFKRVKQFIENFRI